MSYNLFLGPYNQVILVVQSNAALWTPALYRHLIITDILLCPWGKKALKFSLNSIRVIRTSRYSRTPLYEHPLNKDTSLSRTVCFVPRERKPLHFLYIQPTVTFYGPLSVHWVWPETYNPEWGYMLLVWHSSHVRTSVILSQESFASHLWLHSSPEPTMSHYENLSKKMTSGQSCSNVGEPYPLDKSLSSQ